MEQTTWKKTSSIDPSNLELSILEHRLWLVGIKKEDSETFLKIILQLIVFSQEKEE